MGCAGGASAKKTTWHLPCHVPTGTPKKIYFKYGGCKLTPCCDSTAKFDHLCLYSYPPTLHNPGQFSHMSLIVIPRATLAPPTHPYSSLQQSHFSLNTLLIQHSYSSCRRHPSFNREDFIIICVSSLPLR